MRADRLRFFRARKMIEHSAAFYVLAQERDRTRHIGRRHTRTAVFVVTAGNGACDLAAVRRDLGL